MLIEKHLLSELKPTAYNPRVDLKPSDKEYQAIKNSIESFGNIEPIIWNKRTGNIVGGHQRYKILKEKGILETEVVVVDFDEQKEKAANLALNKAVGLWDDEAVNILLNELKDTEWKMEDYNFDLSDFNFDLSDDTEDNSNIDLSDSYEPSYEIIVVFFKQHKDMEPLFTRLTEEGYECKLSTL